jgi:DivIVA domain-containing protein
MELKDIESLRVQGFTVARRGYDRREVDKFLGALAEWLETDAIKELGGSAIKRKLELAGKSTAQILLTTEQESEQMRQQTEEECADLRARSKATADETRSAADAYAKKVREKADEDARQAREAASAKAKATIEEGARRRAQIDGLVVHLEGRRDDTLGELERLHSELASTIDKHVPPSRANRRNGREDGQSAEAEEKKKPARAKAKATPTAQ